MICLSKFSPVYPCAQEQVYCSSDFKLHVPPCWQGDESHAFFSCISHSDAVKPMGHVHVKTGVPSLKLTVHVPPFWHLGPGPVWHGFGYWQNSPTYREEQLKIIINLNYFCNMVKRYVAHKAPYFLMATNKFEKKIRNNKF